MPFSLLLTEAGLIAALQTIGTWLVPVLIAFTALGYEEFYLLVVPFTYWCMDSGLGIRLGAMLMISQSTNEMAKLVFHTPRPYWISKEVAAFSSETSFGAPSNHAQISMSMWGTLAAWARRRWVTIVCVVVIFMIGFSRIYLGMHFISDVLIGWIIGGLLLLAFLRWEKPFIHQFIRFSLWRQLALIFLGAAFILTARGLIQELLSGWQMPAEWAANALTARPDNQIAPLEVKGVFTQIGVWLGLLGGLAWYYHRWGKFDASGTPWQLLARYLIGAAGIILLWGGLGKLFPSSTDTLGLILRTVRYLLIGLWVSAVTPLLFIRLKLAKHGPKTERII